MRLLVLLTLCWLWQAESAIGDMIVLRDITAQPVYGRIVEQTRQTIVLDKIAGSDFLAPMRVRFATDEVERVIRNIDEERLVRLTPTKLSEYRDYAEELAEQKADPVARALAIRLFLIVAYGCEDNSAFGQSMKNGALQALIDLARSEQESRSFRSLVQLHGGEINALEISQPVNRLDVHSGSGDSDRVMLNLLRMLRKGENSQVLQKLEDESNAQAIERWSDVCSRKELMQMAMQPRLQTGDLRRLLMIELAIETGQTVEQLIAGQKTSGDRLPYDWASVAEKTVSEIWRLPHMERITEFDPRNSIYRDGRWMRPDQNR